MTPTAEERAQTLVRDLEHGRCLHRPQSPPCADCSRTLAVVQIRAAEAAARDEALEQAAQTVLNCSFAAGPVWVMAAQAHAEAIRALKEPK